MAESSATRQAPLREIAIVFLKLGTVAFGGPAAHLAMMEEEFVRRRQWITHAEFLDRLATANLIPGPSSTEVAIFVGQLKRGWRGLVVAGCCFIIPAAVMVSLIAWAYVRYGSLPKAEGMLYAVKPAVVAIVIQALGKLSRTGLRTTLLAVIALLSVGLSVLGLSPVLVLVIAGLIAALSFSMRNHLLSGLIGVGMRGRMNGVMWPGFTHVAPGVAAVTVGSVAFPVQLAKLFVSFLKVGSVVFGSGYVLLAFLQTEFVARLHWLTDQQLMDAVAVGQFTPGPLFTTATFIGYVVAGWWGAAVATIGIFLPGFLLVAVSGPLIPRLRRSATASAGIDGVVAGSLALIAVVAWQLGKASIIDRATLGLFIAGLVALLRFRVNSAWVVGVAAAIGFIVR